jgi:glycyl-tRNA synthetase beta subunit
LARHVLLREIEAIVFDQTMRWIGTPGESAEAVALRRTTFSRPIRWLLALHGEQVVPLRFAGLLAGRETRSLRFGDPEVLSIARASAYRGALAKAGVVVDPAERRRLILEQARALAAAVEGEIDSEVDLADELSQLAGGAAPARQLRSCLSDVAGRGPGGGDEEAPALFPRAQSVGRAAAALHRCA